MMNFIVTANIWPAPSEILEGGFFWAVSGDRPTFVLFSVGAKLMGLNRPGASQF